VRNVPGVLLQHVPGHSYSCQLRWGASPTPSPPSPHPYLLTPRTCVCVGGGGTTAISDLLRAQKQEAWGKHAKCLQLTYHFSLLKGSHFHQGSLLPSGVGSIIGEPSTATAISVLKRTAILHNTSIITRLL
jgi:hypothetical protein